MYAFYSVLSFGSQRFRTLSFAFLNSHGLKKVVSCTTKVKRTIEGKKKRVNFKGIFTVGFVCFFVFFSPAILVETVNLATRLIS